MIPVMIECVPNFSEGRNPHTIAALARVIGHLNGIAVLGFESDADHHRSVITFAGEPEAVLEAAVSVYEPDFLVRDFRQQFP